MNALSYRTELITPQLAEEYINTNVTNRALRPGIVEKYAQDMKDGNWTECPAPIVFYEDRTLADGQHRLWAIIESNISQQFLVMRGLPVGAALNIDTGLGRNLIDNAIIAGNTDLALSTNVVAAARAIEEGCKAQATFSNAQKMLIVRKHYEAASWAIHHGPNGKWLRNSIVIGALGRAYYHEHDKNKLARFGEVVRTGIPESLSESAAAALRAYIQTMGAKGMSLTQGSMWTDTFRRAQNAIYYFMRGNPLTVCKPIQEERYPLPKSMQAAPPQKRKTK